MSTKRLKALPIGNRKNGKISIDKQPAQDQKEKNNEAGSALKNGQRPLFFAFDTASYAARFYFYSC